MVSKEMAPQIGWLDDYIVHLLLLPLSREMGDGSKALFRSHQNFKFFYSLFIILIFGHMHGALNVGKKNN